MRLFKMILHNFRQYGKHEVIKFPKEGLIGVVGKNGAGKSTLFNAIGWCLYGKIKDVNKDMILNVSADKKADDCYVELFFELHGVKYHVKRDLKKTNNCFVKTADGTPYAIGTSNVNSYIEENLFKMDYNAFCSCYYAEQDDFDNLVKLTPAKRVATISKLLRIDAIDKASENVRREYRTLKTEVDEARKHLRDEKDLEKQKKELQNQIFTVTANIGRMAKELDARNNEYKELLVEKAEGEKEYQSFRELTNNSKNTKDKIETLVNRSLNKDKNELDDLIKMKNRYDEIAKYKQVYHILKEQKEEMTSARSEFKEKEKIQKEMATIQVEVEKYKNEFDGIKENLLSFSNTENDLKEKENKVVVLQNTLSSMKENYQEKSILLRTKMEKMKELKEQKDTFVEMGSDSPCETCGRPLGDHYDERMEHIKDEVNELVTLAKVTQEELKSIEIKMKEKNEELNALNIDISKLRDDLLKKNSYLERSNLLKNELTLRKERYKTAKEQYEAVKDVVFDEEKYKDVENKLTKATKLYEEILTMENSIKKIPSLEASIEEVSAEIANLEQLLANMQHELKNLNFNEEVYLELDKKVKNLQDTIQNKKDEKTNAEFSVKSLEKDISIIDEKLAENENMMIEIREKEKKMVLRGKLDIAYKQYKSDILSKLAPTLSEIMSNDIEVMTNAKYNQVELDDEYNIYIYRNNEKQPLSFFSGGEKKLAALCQRLAISGLLVGQTGQESFDMLAMDEVFGSFDNERQDNVIDMLRNLNEKFPQILIVSHSDTVKGLFDHVIEIVQNDDGNSTFKWLTEWDDSDVDDELAEFEDFEEAS